MSNEQHPTIDQLTDYVHGELAPHDDATIHAHLSSCGACSEARDEEIRLGEILREHARSEELELPPGLRTRILALAADDHPAQTSWLHRIGLAFRPAIALPIAAGLAIGMYLAFASTHAPARAASIDAAYYLQDHAALATATMPFFDGGTAPATLTADDGAVDEKAIDAGR